MCIISEEEKEGMGKGGREEMKETRKRREEGGREEREREEARLEEKKKGQRGSTRDRRGDLKR